MGSAAFLVCFGPMASCEDLTPDLAALSIDRVPSATMRPADSKAAAPQRYVLLDCPRSPPLAAPSGASTGASTGGPGGVGGLSGRSASKAPPALSTPAPPTGVWGDELSAPKAASFGGPRGHGSLAQGLSFSSSLAQARSFSTSRRGSVRYVNAAGRQPTDEDEAARGATAVLEASSPLPSSLPLPSLASLPGAG